MADVNVTVLNGVVNVAVAGSELIQPQIAQATEAADRAEAAGAVVDAFTANSRRLAGAPRASASDATGNRLFEIGRRRIEHPDTNAMRARGRQHRRAIATLCARTAEAELALMRLLGSLLHILCHGQSLSQGDPADGNIVTGPLAYALMFNSGPRPHDAGTDPAVIYQSLVPYGERDARETVMGAAFKMFAQLLRDEQGIDLAAAGQKLMGSAPGQGGASMAALRFDSGDPNLYQRMLANVSNAARLAAAAGEAYQLAGMFFIQGEAEYELQAQATAEAPYYGVDQWAAWLEELRVAARAQAKASGGVDRPLPVFLYQTATHPFHGIGNPDIAMKQLELARTNPLYIMASPTHFLDFKYEVDSAPKRQHLTAASYDWLGAHFGLALYRLYVDGEKIEPLVPIETTAVGSTVLARFNVGDRRLVLDEELIAPANSGVELATAAGDPIAVTGVRVVGRDVLMVQTASPRAAGERLRLGWRPADGQAWRGVCTIRDDSGLDLIYDPMGLAKPLHRWAPISEWIVGA